MIINFLILLRLFDYLLLLTSQSLGVLYVSKNLEHVMKRSIVSRIVGSVDDVCPFTNGATQLL